MCTRVKFGQIVISWLLDTAEQIWEASRHQKGVVDDSSSTILHHVERYIPIKLLLDSYNHLTNGSYASQISFKFTKRSVKNYHLQ